MQRQRANSFHVSAPLRTFQYRVVQTRQSSLGTLGWAVFYIICAMTNAVIEYGQALYYPHVRFRSRQWLRTSLLYHDKIWRIVPPGLDDYELELGYGLPDSKIID